MHGTEQLPELPYRIAQYVLTILGLTNYGPFSSHMVHMDASLAQPEAGSSNSCLALTGLPDACNVPANFAADYGLNALYRQGATGAGQTVAIVTLAALDPGRSALLLGGRAQAAFKPPHRHGCQRRWRPG